MREIGIVKWFGGFNVNRNKYNDYGYILKKNGEEVYVNRNHLRCKGEVLKPNTLVTFELGINFKNNEKQAMKVKLLKKGKDKELIEKFLQEEDKKFLSNLPQNINFKMEIFNFLLPLEQVELLHTLEQKRLCEYWNFASREVKILFIYKCAKENLNISVLEKVKENDKIVRYCLIILWIKFNQDKKNIGFKKAQKLMESYLKEVKTKENLKPLFITCLYDSKRCCDSSMVADIKFDCSLPYYKWSLNELLHSANIVLTVDGKDETNKYIFKISKYINDLE